MSQIFNLENFNKTDQAGKYQQDVNIFHSGIVGTAFIPPVYIEQRTVAKVQPLESNKWDYCEKPEGYYPPVKECPVGWQRVEPQPSDQEPGYWYYCTDPAGYYPYVRACSANWQKVVVP